MKESPEAIHLMRLLGPPTECAEVTIFALVSTETFQRWTVSALNVVCFISLMKEVCMLSISARLYNPLTV